MDRIDNFNNIRRSLFPFSQILVVDESMSALVPKTTAHEGLSNISYIARNPEPLDT